MRVTTLLLIVLALSGLAYLVWWDYQTPDIRFMQAFVMVVWLNVTLTCLMAWRSFILSKKQIAFSRCLQATGLAITGLWFIPARLSEFIKPFYFHHFASYPREQGLALTIKERLWDLVGFSCICVLCVTTLGTSHDLSQEILLYAGLFAGLCICVFGAFAVLPFVVDRVKQLSFLRPFLDAMRQDTIRDKSVQFGVAVILWAGSALLAGLFYSFSGLPRLDMDHLLLLFVVSTLGQLITVTPAGVGTHEVAVIALLSQFGVSVADAAAFAIGLRLCWMATPTIIGLYALMKDGLSFLEKRDGLSG